MNHCLLTEHTNQSTETPGSGGSWVYTSGPAIVVAGGNNVNPGSSVPGGDNPCVDINDCGVYTFTYTTDPTSVCLGESATLTIHSYDVDITETTAAACNYSFVIENQNIPGNLTADHTIDSNSEDSVFTYRQKVVQNCSGTLTDLEDNIQTIVTPIGTVQYNGFGGPPSGGGLFAGGFLEFIKVHRDDGNGNITSTQINLAPGTATLSGCAGTANAADLTAATNFPAVAAFEAALQIVIENELCNVWGATNGVDYDLNVTCLLQGTVSWSIPFGIKNDPTGQWIGIDKNDLDCQWQRSDTGPTFTEANLVGNRVNQGNFIPAVHNYSAPCGDIAIRVSLTTPPAERLDIASSNFNIGVPNTPITLLLANEAGLDPDIFCPGGSELTGSLCDAAGGAFDTVCTNENITWSGPNPPYTGNPITTNGAGTYTATLTCTEIPGGCTNSITVT